MSGGLLLQLLLHYNFSVAVAIGYIALFGIAVETGVIMVAYLHEALEHIDVEIHYCREPLFVSKADVKTTVAGGSWDGEESVAQTRETIGVCSK